DFARRLLAEAGEERVAWVDRGFRLPLSRRPRPAARAPFVGGLGEEGGWRGRASGPGPTSARRSSPRPSSSTRIRRPTGVHDPRFISCGRYMRPATRRQFLARAGAGLGLVALGDLLLSQTPASGDESPAAGVMAPREPHFAAKAKS